MAAIAPQFRAYWRELRDGEPGRRFQARYERVRVGEKRQGKAGRILLILLAIVLLVIAAFLAVFPGPAVPFFILGGGLLAAESRPVARFMDWSEVQFRKLFDRAKRHWRRLPTAMRVILIVCGVCCSATTAYFSYRLFRG